MNSIPDPTALRRMWTDGPPDYSILDWREERAVRRLQKRQMQAAGEWVERAVMDTADLGTARLIENILAAAPTRRYAQIDAAVDQVFRDKVRGVPPWHQFDVFEELADRFASVGFVVTWEKLANGHIELTVAW